MTFAKDMNKCLKPEGGWNTLNVHLWVLCAIQPCSVRQGLQ